MSCVLICGDERGKTADGAKPAVVGRMVLWMKREFWIGVGELADEVKAGQLASGFDGRATGGEILVATGGGNPRWIT